MTRRRWSTFAICVGLVVALGAVAFRLFAVPALVRFPLDVNETTHYTGIATTYVDETTLLPLATPKREPVSVDRHVRVVDGDFSTAVVAETITIKTPSATSVENYQYAMDRRTMQFRDDSREYAFGNPASTMQAQDGYRVSFPMGTTADGSYQAFIPEANTLVPMVLERGSHYNAKARTTVIDFSTKLEAPVPDYYKRHLSDIGLPMQVTPTQLQPQLLAAGIDIPRALADIGSRLTPDESALIRTTLTTPVPLQYFFKVDGVLSIEPKTGALIDVYSKQEGVEVRPDLSGATALQPMLDKYADIPSVKAVSDGLAKLAQAKPQPAQLLEWTQTQASSQHMAGIASDQARMMTVVTWWVPIALGVLGAALVALGLFLRHRAGRGRPNANVEQGRPTPPQEPVEPVRPPLEPVGAPASPDRVPEHV